MIPDSLRLAPPPEWTVKAKCLLEAQQKAEALFEAVVGTGLIQAGRSESAVSQSVFELAMERFGIRKYWHKRIVRAGENTLLPYRHNPPNRIIEADDIVFLDFGPIFDEWEADFGRTYVLGDDPLKHKLKADTEALFISGCNYFAAHQRSITGSQLYAYMVEQAKQAGWTFGGSHAGHLVGKFPHEKVLGETVQNYIHSDNHQPMAALDNQGEPRHWILESHLVDLDRKFGAFVEALIMPGEVIGEDLPGV